MRSDCCRSAGLPPDTVSADFARGTIPGAVPGFIPEEFSASQPIYLDGPISLDEFLAQGEQPKNNLDMTPSQAEQERFLWPVTSRFSFVSAVLLALLTAVSITTKAQASDENSYKPSSSSDSGNVKIAARTDSGSESSGRIISFVCGRPNTLQVLAPIDLPEAKTVRFLPQGASPIAEMSFMPAARKTDTAKPSVKRSSKNGSDTKVDPAANERVYQRLLKLSLADPAVYQAEGSSLITYFSILTGGQDQKRVAELEKILEKNLNTK